MCVIELKKGAPAEVIENQSYKLTTLQASFSMNLLAIHNNRPATMGLLQLLQAFLDFREDVPRRCLFELAKARTPSISWTALEGVRAHSTRSWRSSRHRVTRC